MSLAARVNDLQSCPIGAPYPHVGGPLQGPGVVTVTIGHQAAAVVGTTCMCAQAFPNVVIKGSSNVTIGHRPAARVGDSTAHGGVIVSGCATVMIGG